MSLSKRRLRTKLAAAAATIADLQMSLERHQAELRDAQPIIAAAEQLRDASAWQIRATCEAEEDRACESVDEAMDAIIAAVDARRAGRPAPDADIPDGWVPDAPDPTADEVAEFLAYEWPGDEEVAA